MKRKRKNKDEVETVPSSPPTIHTRRKKPLNDATILKQETELANEFVRTEGGEKKRSSCFSLLHFLRLVHIVPFHFPFFFSSKLSPSFSFS